MSKLKEIQELRSTSLSYNKGYHSELLPSLFNHPKSKKKFKAQRITLCGSTRFKKEFEDWNRILTSMGHTVYSVGVFSKSQEKMTNAEKQLLDMVHLDKIARSDSIVVIDSDDYIGDSTRSEVNFALSNSINIFWTSFLPEVERLRRVVQEIHGLHDTVDENISQTEGSTS